MDAKDRIIEQRMAKRRRSSLILRSIIAGLIFLIILCFGILMYAGVKYGTFNQIFHEVLTSMGLKITEPDESGHVTVVDNVDEPEQAVTEKKIDYSALLVQAQLMRDQYNYQGAIDLIKSCDDYNINTQLQNFAGACQQEKDACIAYPVDQIPHVFFHTMIKDTAKAFDGDEDEAGYNQVMTTISEFNSIIEQMYERGYVMVSVHDMCSVGEDGTVTKKEIRLPEGKTPFVLSQDDVSYYHYMDGDGFAGKLIIDENGDIKNTYIENDGSVTIGDFDMVPLIDTFVREHPDFSYYGHKGIIALTGYEGVLGYRTDEVYKTRQPERVTQYQQAFFDAHPDFDWEREVEQARAVAQAMKEDGWEFASHTWGHINPLGYGYNATMQDTQRWLDNVASVVGDTDVLIFAFGADINDWTPYTMNNEFFAYLKKQGFSIYCNVDGSQKYWVQFGNDYMRQGRRNLDGYRMYYNPELLSDLFDVEMAWDQTRPTPVPQM